MLSRIWNRTVFKKMPLNIMVIGASGVGKSHLSYSFANNSPYKAQVPASTTPEKIKVTAQTSDGVCELYMTTLPGFYVKSLIATKKSAETATTIKCCQNADAVIVMFDTTDKESFNIALEQIKYLSQHYPSKPIYLIGNKRNTKQDVVLPLDVSQEFSKFKNTHNQEFASVDLNDANSLNTLKQLIAENTLAFIKQEDNLAGYKQNAQSWYQTAKAKTFKAYDYALTNKRTIAEALVAIVASYYAITTVLKLLPWLLAGTAVAYVGYKVWDVVNNRSGQYSNTVYGTRDPVIIAFHVVGSLGVTLAASAYSYTRGLVVRLYQGQQTNNAANVVKTDPNSTTVPTPTMTSSSSDARTHKKLGSRPRAAKAAVQQPAVPNPEVDHTQHLPSATLGQAATSTATPAVSSPRP